MIQFFRRIRKKLINEGSLSKYLVYAFGEIALVMIGILLALQVNNWNNTRQDRLLESEMLQELKEDMLVNLQRLHEGIESMQMQRDQVSSAMVLFDQVIGSQDSIKKKLSPFHNRAVVTFDPVSGTINDILISDKLKLVQNQDLRRKISDWNGLLEDTKEEERKILHIKQYDMSPYMSKCCPRTKHFNVDLEKVFKDYQFENILLAYDDMLRVTIRDYGPVKAYMEELINMIDKEIGESR